MPEDKHVIVKIGKFSSLEITENKIVGVLISFQWKSLLLNEAIGDDCGLRIVRGKKKISHESYLRALCDLLSAHNFKEIRFVLAGTLQRYNLVSARGESIDNAEEMDRAEKELRKLESCWVKKYLPLICSVLPKKKVVIQHWSELISEKNHKEKKYEFQQLYLNNKTVSDAFDKEKKSFLNRQEHGLEFFERAMTAYLEEEMTSIVKQVLQSQLDYLIYNNDMPTIRAIQDVDKTMRGQFLVATLGHNTFYEFYNRYRTNKRKAVVLLGEGVECDRKKIEKSAHIFDSCFDMAYKEIFSKENNAKK